MKKLLFLLVLNPILMLHAQNPNIKRTWHWYFGNQAGIDFSSGMAVGDTNSQMNTSEGCAAMSDTSGNLLFYTDGRTVWNNLHQVMPNGTGLLGGSLGSSMQAALILPKPLSQNLYYLFTTDEEENGGVNGLRYSIIDMNLDNGNGDVVALQKNTLLFAPCTEKLNAINHCNDSSIWIVSHEVNNNNFRSYLLTANGIDTNNFVISSIGWPNMLNTLNAITGPIKFSPDGTKLCAVTDSFDIRVQLFNFDIYTGIISNCITLSNSYFTAGISFSPDNSKLYIGTNSINSLFQYDVSVYDSVTILNSKTLIYHDSIFGSYGPRFMQNASDGKIYINRGDAFDTTLYSIDSPNNSGVTCNINYTGANLLNKIARAGLPNFNESYFNQTTPAGCPTGVSEHLLEKFLIYPNPARDWIVLEGSGIKSIEIMNILGNKRIFYPLTTTSLQNKINTSSLSCGIYFLRINMIDERCCFQKVIKQY